MKLQRLLKWSGGGVLIAFLALVGWGFISYWTGTNECDEKTGALVHPMKLVRYFEYGIVTFDDVEKPVPKDNQVLIKVRAASLNWLDAAVVRHPARQVAHLLARIGVAHHHLELAAQRGPERRHREHGLGQGPGVLEVLELLEQRHRPQLSGREPGGALQEQHLEQVGE